MTTAADDVRFMQQALELARRGWGTTHPNPMVGAVIVEEGRVVAEGWHARAGGAHAEVAALEALGRRPAPGAALVVTLEPCSTTGRTGPCTEAILAAGIRRVVVGAVDPNPAHGGRGLALLRGAGVEVVEGVLAADCEDLNLIFNHWIVKGGPLVAGKSAATLDGRIATRTGHSQWITGEAARADVHRWRRLFPAIAVGAGTILADNPRLTSRLPGAPEWCPVRFVFDGLLRTVTDRNMPNVYTDGFLDHTIVATTEHAGMGYVKKLQAMGVQTWVFRSQTSRVPMEDFRSRCAEAGLTGVYIEGGEQLLSALMAGQSIDYAFHYRSPLLLADEKSKPLLRGLRTDRLEQGVRLTRVRHESFGDDVLVRGFVSYPEKMQVDETVFVRGGLRAGW